MYNNEIVANTMTQITVEEFRDFFKHYNSEEHQIAAVEELYAELDGTAMVRSDAKWMDIYRNPAPVQAPTTPGVTNPINVPYQSQNDNLSGTGFRECFSSSCAMVAMYYGRIKNDDEYNKVRARYGDTTDAQAQVHALRSLGLHANFITNATEAELKHQIDMGKPTPCGWLHSGNVSYPTGGGHYSVVIGYDKTGWIHHDPNGEARLVAGGYTDNWHGENLHYSYKNWNPRWLVEGPGSGWMMDIYE